MTNSAFIRPAWTPATIALMVLGFVVFWPLGLAMLAYILWGDRLDGFKSEVNRATDDVTNKFKCGFKSDFKSRKYESTGNVAFDEWREVELARLEEERRKLDETRDQFDEYLRELRRARDQKEFDEFLKSRKDTKTTKRNPRKSVPDT